MGIGRLTVHPERGLNRVSSVQTAPETFQRRTRRGSSSSSASSIDFTGCSNSSSELWDFIEKGVEGGVNRDKRELMSRGLLLDLTVLLSEFLLSG